MTSIAVRLRLFCGFTICAWLILFGRDRHIVEILDFLAELFAPFRGAADQPPRPHGDQR